MTSCQIWFGYLRIDWKNDADPVPSNIFLSPEFLWLRPGKIADFSLIELVPQVPWYSLVLLPVPHWCFLYERRRTHGNLDIRPLLDPSRPSPHFPPPSSAQFAAPRLLIFGFRTRPRVCASPIAPHVFFQLALTLFLYIDLSLFNPLRASRHLPALEVFSRDFLLTSRLWYPSTLIEVPVVKF